MKIESILPVIAPAPPAVVVGMQLYQEVLAVSPANWWPLAAFAAFLGAVGTIGAEMMAYKMALRALGDGQRGAFWVGLAGALVTSGLIVWVVWRSDDSRPLVAGVLVAVVAYMVSGLGDYLTARREQAQVQADGALALLQAQADVERERAKTARAQARAARFANGVRGVREQGRPVHEQGESVREPGRRGMPAEKIAEIRAYWDAHPQATVREVAGACQVSVGSAAKFRRHDAV